MTFYETQQQQTALAITMRKTNSTFPSLPLLTHYSPDCLHRAFKGECIIQGNVKAFHTVCRSIGRADHIRMFAKLRVYI
jgi:hypothetical protein